VIPLSSHALMRSDDEMIWNESSFDHEIKSETKNSCSSNFYHKICDNREVHFCIVLTSKKPNKGICSVSWNETTLWNKSIRIKAETICKVILSAFSNFPISLHVPFVYSCFSSPNWKWPRCDIVVIVQFRDNT